MKIGNPSDINLFYKYYDLLFSDKDYDQEASCVVEIASEFLKGPVNKLLEIGCGTGNHTLAFAAHNIHITAVDIDKTMIDIAKRKIADRGAKNITVFHGGIEDLNTAKCRVACALFNVVSYLPNRKELDAFFNAVFNHLAADSLFIFDCFNGIAAILDPPGQKETVTTAGENTIKCRLASQTDLFNQHMRLTYHISVHNSDGKIIEQDIYSVDQFLWTPREVSFALIAAGFGAHHISPIFKPDEPATKDDWKIMFVCKKGVVN